MSTTVIGTCIDMHSKRDWAMKLAIAIVYALYVLLAFKLMLFIYVAFRYSLQEVWPFYKFIVFHPFSIVVYIHIAIMSIEDYREYLSTKELNQ
jgi:biotin transporter BioY